MASSAAQICTLPPAGWVCSRGAGHEGPCAASALPHCEGHYWAKQTATEHGDAMELSDAWEVVQTFDNAGIGFALRVLVPGVPRSEPVENFQWGPRVIAPKGCEA
jgi:hypothetical protein